jgi:hypothetical protein
MLTLDECSTTSEDLEDDKTPTVHVWWEQCEKAEQIHVCCIMYVPSLQLQWNIPITRLWEYRTSVGEWKCDGGEYQSHAIEK